MIPPSNHHPPPLRKCFLRSWEFVNFLLTADKKSKAQGGFASFLTPQKAVGVIPLMR